MKGWQKISFLLCVFGFFREMRPSEPYITEFLMGEWHNFTSDQVNRDIFPIGTYSYLAQLIIVFLITDFLRYKPLIIATGICGIIVWSNLIWSHTLLFIQIGQIFYGTYTAAEVAYYTYIYAKVDRKYYARVTSHTRAATFAGKFVASTLAQLVLYFNLMNYRDLNYVTLAAQTFAAVWAFGLPKVQRSLYFHRETNTSEIVEEPQNFNSTKVINKDTTSISSRYSEKLIQDSAFKLLWQHFCSAYTNLKVVQWSIWYAVGLCGYLQVITYIQVLWKDIDPDLLVAWNGAVDAVLTALATLSTLSAGYIHAGRLNQTASLLVLATLSIFEGAAILFCCSIMNVYWSYLGYIIFGVLYAFTIAVASSEVARYLEQDSFGLVFGINTFIALALQSLLTLVVVSDVGFALNTKGQFKVYSYYFIIIGIIYFIAVVIEYIVKRRSKLRIMLE